MASDQGQGKGHKDRGLGPRSFVALPWPRSDATKPDLRGACFYSDTALCKKSDQYIHYRHRNGHLKRAKWGACWHGWPWHILRRDCRSRAGEPRRQLGSLPSGLGWTQSSPLPRTQVLDDKSLTTGWVSQQRPGGGGATATERLERLTETAGRATRANKKAGKVPHPRSLLCQTRRFKNFGLEQLRRPCRVRMNGNKWRSSHLINLLCAVGLNGWRTQNSTYSIYNIISVGNGSRLNFVEYFKVVTKRDLCIKLDWTSWNRGTSLEAC